MTSATVSVASVSARNEWLSGDIASRIGEWAAGFEPTAAQLARVSASIRDFAACVVAGTRRPELRPAMWLAHGGGVPVWGLADSFDPAGAALVCGTAGALLQLHDVYRPGGLHPSSPIIPAAWSALHSLGVGRSEHFVRAVALGYEVANRFALACTPGQVASGSTPTATAGALGAAISSAVVAGYDAVGIARAVSNSALFMPIVPFLTMTTHGALAPLHGGLAARAGFEAARVSRDASAGSSLLEGTAQMPGLIALLGGDPKRLIPESWDGGTLDQIAWKFFPACLSSITALEAILRLEPVAVESIERVTLRLPDRMLSLVDGGPDAGHLYDRLMSLRWVTARAIEQGRYDAADAGTDSQVATQLAQRIEIIHAPMLDELQDQLAADIELRSEAGIQRIEYRRGIDAEPSTPGPRGWTSTLDVIALEEKFLALVGPGAVAGLETTLKFLKVA